MAAKAKEKAKDTESTKRYYKGYDMKWLAELPEHPDYHLVEESGWKEEE